MAVPPQGTRRPLEVRRFGPPEPLDVPLLRELAGRSYAWFLGSGLQTVLEESFPITFKVGRKAATLSYLGHTLSQAPHDPDTCRRLGLTYGQPLRVRFQLTQDEQTQEDTVELGLIPVPVEGTFIISGSSRVFIGQLVRVPGIRFFFEGPARAGPRYACSIWPQRGSRLTLSITEGGKLRAAVDRGKAVPGLALLRAVDPQYAGDAALLRAFYPTTTLPLDPSAPDQLLRRILADFATAGKEDGRNLPQRGEALTRQGIAQLAAAGVREVVLLEEKDPDRLIISSLEEERAAARKQSWSARHRGCSGKTAEAAGKIKRKLVEAEGYDLGAEGRRRLNEALGHGVPAETTTLDARDCLLAIKRLLELRAGRAEVEDHIADRRVRAVGEFAADSLRRALRELRRKLQEEPRSTRESKRRRQAEDKEADPDAEPAKETRISFQPKGLTPRDLIPDRLVPGFLAHLFGSSALSQVADQTNPLAQLTHERRLSLMGPAGLSRQQASQMVLDLDVLQYGRLCPVETAEGANMGLLCTLSLFARVGEGGFLEAPYRPVRQRQVNTDPAAVVWLTAEQEARAWIACADTPLDGQNRLRPERVLGRRGGTFAEVEAGRIEYIDTSPRQLVGLSAGLIPFLEHDDAMRALMGSNMQRQAVPLLAPRPPRVATGLEKEAAAQSGMAVRARSAGTVSYVDAQRIRVRVGPDRHDEYPLSKFAPLNGKICLNHKPVVRVSQVVAEGEVLADGPAMSGGQLALGRDVLVAFVCWEGYNFEDGIVISQRLVRQDLFTSLHITEFEAEARAWTKDRREAFTPSPPGAPQRDRARLDKNGIVTVGAFVRPGDVLVGKVTPTEKRALSPVEKLRTAAHAVQSQDAVQAAKGPREHWAPKNDSLQAPEGLEGVVIETRLYQGRDGLPEGVEQKAKVFVVSKRPIKVGDKMSGRHGNKGVVACILPVEDMPFLADGTPVDVVLNPLGVPSRLNVGQILETLLGWAAQKLGFQAVTPVFTGASEDDVRQVLKEAGLTEGVDLYDGRTGERLAQPVTVGSMYMLKLRHLVDDKIHARSTGSYSLISQQPLGGRSRGGGQRLGEMEVWALEANGAAEILQELMTVKADDVEGRRKLYEALLEGRDQVDAGTPASFEVLRSELRGLALDLRWEEGPPAPIPDSPPLEGP
jgi:DNA-directed RNA polymerase subunit beta